MFRVVLVLVTLATAGLVVASAFFCDEGEIGEINDAAMLHYRKGQFAEAAAVWEEGLTRFPDAWQLNYRYGTILAVRGNFAGAERYLKRALELKGDHPEIRKELALSYLQDERYDDAERELKAVLAQKEWFPETHYYLGTIYEKRGQTDLARKEYVQELNHNPGCTFAWAKVLTDRN